MSYSQPFYVTPSPYLCFAEPSPDIDIKRSDSPFTVTDPWTMGEYLADKRSPIGLCPAINSIGSGIVPPLPHAQFSRADSPSFTNSSSTCSSGLSPPREVEYYHARSPPTPSDAAMSSQCGSWDPYPHVYQFTGLADGCVNLGDINPVQLSYYGDEITEFDPPINACGISHDGSNAGRQVWTEDEQQSHERDMSPEPQVKEEDQAEEQAKTLHTFQAHNMKPSQSIETFPLKTERDMEDEVETDEDEYIPYLNAPKNESLRATHTIKSHKRHIISQSTLESKRLKTTLVDSVVARSGIKPYACPDCVKVTFKDRIGLDNHIKKQHTRPFLCIFEFAGCRSTFASKNEWKRHCASQHIVLHYWVCQQDSCAQVSNEPAAPKKSSSAAGRKRNDCHRHPVPHSSALPNGTIFNRKDLYTQHLRRMHIPAHLKNKVKSKTHVPEWEQQQRLCQEKALRIRCQLPTQMLCPAANCDVQFDGKNAWDEHMEHVAKHLEKAATNAEAPMRFDGESNGTLVNWATSPAIGILKKGDKGSWALLNPLKVASHQCSPPRETTSYEGSDVDADGEDE